MPPTQDTISNDNNDDREKSSIEICVAQADDHDRLLNFLRNHYYPEEPLTAGCEPKEQEAADEEFNMSNIKHGTCLIAVRNRTVASGEEERKNNGGKEVESGEAMEEILGAVIAGPKDRHELEHLEREAELFGYTSKWGRILKILACIEREANVFERFGVERALHCHALGVHSSARGLSLGAQLMQQLIELGRKKNFQLLTVDCSSLYSARLCERLGMECVNVKRFEDHCDENGKQVFHPQPPHNEIKTLAIRLDKGNII